MATFPFGNSSTALIGRFGQLEVGSRVIARLTQWTVTEALATTSEWGDSDGNGFTQRAPGRRSATIAAEGKFDVTSRQPILIRPGNIYTVRCWMHKSGAVAAQIAYHFPRVITTSFELVVNVDTEEVIGWTAEFQSDGIFYYPGEEASPGTPIDKPTSA